MTRCTSFWHKFEQEGNFCGMDPSEITRVRAYLEFVRKLENTGCDKDFIFRNFTSGAARPIIALKDDETRTEALNYVAHCLERKEKVTENDLRNHIKSLLEAAGKSCTVSPPVRSTRSVNLTNVKNQSQSEPEIANGTKSEKPDNNCEPVRGSSLFKTAAEVKAGIAGEMFPDNKPAEPAATEAPPAWSTAVCTSGKCPDGNTHVVSWQLGKKCDLSGMFLKDQTFCPILERQKRAAEQGFVPAGTAAPQVCSATGGTIRRELPPLVAKKGQPEIVYHPTPKQYEFIERVMRLEDLKTPEDAINLLVEQAMEAQV